MLAHTAVAGLKVDNGSLLRTTAIVRDYPWRRILAPSVIFLIVLSLSKVAMDSLYDPAVFPVKEVKVEGGFTYLDRQDVIGAVSDVAKQGFFRLDLGELVERLERLPWMKKAAVRRVWPDTLAVEVVERSAFALWGKTGLVSMDGDAFFPDMTRIPKGLPSLIGPKGSAQEMTVFYRKLVDIFIQHKLQVTQLYLNDRRAWELELNNGLVLKLGRDQGLERIRKLMTVYSSVIGERVNEIEYVDLRYPNGFAVQWRNGVVITAEQQR